MYLQQPCPNCGQPAEFVYVQIGHSHACKKCNQEFQFKPQGVNYGKYVIAGFILVFLIGFGCFLLKTFHDWWVYRKP